MKLTMIVPAFNAEKYIEKCVRSIARQPVESLQLVIVDDHSTDHTYALCQKLQSVFPFIELCQTEGKGVSDARNTGLKRADGEIVGFCDADDFLEENVLQKVLDEFIRDETLDIGCFGFDRLSADDRLLGKNRLKRRRLSAGQLFERVLLDQRVMGSVWNKFYRRELLSGARFESGLTYCEDTAFNAGILLRHKDANCLLSDMCIYHYVVNPLSGTHNRQALYEADGTLKYNESMYFIRDMAETSRQRRCVDRAIYRLSVEAYFYTATEEEQKKLLRTETGRCFLTNLPALFRYDALQNAKAVVKGVLILLARTQTAGPKGEPGGSE